MHMWEECSGPSFQGPLCFPLLLVYIQIDDFVLCGDLGQFFSEVLSVSQQEGPLLQLLVLALHYQHCVPVCSKWKAAPIQPI